MPGANHDWSTEVSEEVISWDEKDVTHHAQIPVSADTYEKARLEYKRIVRRNRGDISALYQKFLDVILEDSKIEMFPGPITYRIGDDTELKTFETTTGIFMIGRLPGCDIQLDARKIHISLIQCLVIRTKYISSGAVFYVIIDFWSVRGTMYSEYISAPHFRHIIRIPGNLPFTIVLGALGLSNPKYVVDKIHFNP